MFRLRLCRILLLNLSAMTFLFVDLHSIFFAFNNTFILFDHIQRKSFWYSVIMSYQSVEMNVKLSALLIVSQNLFVNDHRNDLHMDVIFAEGLSRGKPRFRQIQRDPTLKSSFSRPRFSTRVASTVKATRSASINWP